MSTVYFIGGAPRVGKTQATISTIQKHPMLGTSTDAVRYVLRQIYTAEQKPALFAILNPKTDKGPGDPMEARIAQQNAESAEIWPSILAYIQSHQKDGLDVVIEGIAVLPEFLQDLTHDYRAVFMGNQSTTHANTIMQHARSNKQDWLHAADAQEIRGLAGFVTGFSKYIEQEAQKYNLPYLEVSDDLFDASIDSAARMLLLDIPV